MEEWNMEVERWSKMEGEMWNGGANWNMEHGGMTPPKGQLEQKIHTP